MQCATSNDISSNARLKLYPEFVLTQVANSDIFIETGWESRSKRGYDVPKKGHGKNKERSIEVSRIRAKSAVRDIALCNRFQFFFTGTLSPDVVDRYDSKEVYRKISNFLRNSVKRKGFQYVIVPELHKDGAIHFHGLCNLGAMRIVRAKSAKGFELSTNKGQPIYNLVDWTLGWSTCIPIDEHYEKTCNYVSKYISKGGTKIFGKWYLSSRNVKKRPDIIVIDRLDYDNFRSEHDLAVTIPVYNDICICQEYTER